MKKHKTLVVFLGLAVVGGALLIWNGGLQTDEAYAYGEIGLGKATEKIMDSNMPQAIKDKLLLDLFTELPRMSGRARLALQKVAASEKTATRSNGTKRQSASTHGKSTEARQNVCKGLYRAYDAVKTACDRQVNRITPSASPSGTTRTTPVGACSALNRIQQHLTDRSCTR